MCIMHYLWVHYVNIQEQTFVAVFAKSNKQGVNGLGPLNMSSAYLNIYMLNSLQWTS